MKLVIKKNNNNNNKWNKYITLKLWYVAMKITSLRSQITSPYVINVKKVKNFNSQHFSSIDINVH